MKKFKINLGSCGGRAMSTSIIHAMDEREAVVKYLQSIDEEVTEEKIGIYLPGTYEHVPKPRARAKTDPLSAPDIKRLDRICEEVVGIEEGLMFGMIPFKYDNLMSAIKPGHPMEILDSILANIFFTIKGGEEPAMEKLEETLENFKGCVSESSRPEIHGSGKSIRISVQRDEANAYFAELSIG